MADDKKKAASPAQGGAKSQTGKAQGQAGGRAAKKAAAAATGYVPKPRPKDYRPRMKSHYETEVRKAMTEKFGYTNIMQVPRIDKIVLNMGVGEAVNDRKKVENAARDLALIAGQKPVVTRARKSIATFKVRDGMALGTKVTLRGDRMYEFLDRFVTIALPRVKDFRGLSPKSFDGRGNYATGLKEHTAFREILVEDDDIWGMDVVVCTTASTDDEARELLKNFNFPFRS